MRHWLETIFVVQAAERRFGDDTVAVADPMVAGRWREPIVSWSGDARPETGVRPSPIVQLDNATPTILSLQGEPRASARLRPREEWLAFIPQAHEGYVSWDEFERIRQPTTLRLTAQRRCLDSRVPVPVARVGSC